MKIRHYILIIFTFICIVINAQVVKFNNTYSVTNGSGVSMNLLKYNKYYCLLGIGGNTLTNQGQGLIFMKIDSLGNKLGEKQIYHPLTLPFYGNSVSNCFTKLDSVKALFTGQIGIATDHGRATLVKINLRTLDTLWLRTYTQPGDSSFLLCSNFLSDSSIISFGFKYNVTSQFKPFMMKVDKNGNYKWHKYLGGYNNNMPVYQKAIALNDNDLVVVGHQVQSWCYPQAFIMRIDTNANKLYTNNLIGLQYPQAADAIIDKDGNLLVAGSYFHISNCNVNPEKIKKYVYKANLNTGNKIICKTYNVAANSTGAYSIAQHTNGIIYIGGATTSTAINSYNYYADVLKITSNLDSITTISFYDNTFGYSQNTNQLIMTPDGGFAAVLSSYPTNNQQQKFWLVKADSSGCYTATCPAVGIKENNISDDEVTIYPNPANELINLVINDVSGNKYQVQILNTLGQLIREEDIQLKDNTATLQLNDLPNGVYTLCLKSSEGIVLKKKMVIGR